MRTPIPDYLNEILDDLRDDDRGAVADYIPGLAAADPDRLAVALTTVEGRTYAAGDSDVEFTIQSMSKPFAYAAALTDRGTAFVDGRIDIEPSGEAFNELSLETGTYRPKNAMINAGAITAHSLLVGEGASRDQRVARALAFFSTLAGRQLRIDEEIYESELETADRNLSIAHMLHNYGIIEDDAHEAVEGYTAQCSILVTVSDIATMAATLATGGVQPVTGERVIAKPVARQTLSAMAAAGMYDAAGSWFSDVGIPAKSGVAGGLLGALPGQVGLGAFSPRLDEHGNSVRGVELFSRMSKDMGFHLMEVETTGSRALREIRTAGDTTTVDLQGTVNFSGAEAILYELDDTAAPSGAVVFDVSRVDAFTDVGRRMVLEAMRRLTLDGLEVGLFDPESKLPDPDMGDGNHPFDAS
ncbi:MULTISPECIES: glutaminase [unclassified Brevibacterium]|uniref:glutaminase n=1 Tax=unclassified Brevibacterium TaxID=2614124 RepID=UPI0010F7B324|nr:MULTISPECIES: glutaminase [unclassified Brevibacterium]MCM1013061.1 glutaminase [Brevibacterium sp. XM4083]